MIHDFNLFSISIFLFFFSVKGFFRFLVTTKKNIKDNELIFEFLASISLLLISSLSLTGSIYYLQESLK